jgi:FlaG/FlaF family flagellin (archaellin)
LKKRTETFTKDCDAISEIIGELMMITIAVVVFGLLVATVFSYNGPADRPQADIDGWVDVGTNTVYFRHGGGELIDVEDLRIILNLNGTSVEISPADLALIYGKPEWGLGDTIEIDTLGVWGITIGEDDYVGATIVHTGAGVVIQTGTLLGEEVVPTATATATATPTPPPTPLPSAPEITSVHNDAPNTTSVVVNYAVNQGDAGTRVAYGTDPSPGNWSVWGNATPVHNVTISGLVENRTYYYSVYAYNGTDPSYYSNSSIYNFTTAEAARIFTPTSAVDTSGGDATVAQVNVSGDGLYTTYTMPKSGFDDSIYQQFNFTTGLADAPLQVLLRINHTGKEVKDVKIRVWEEDTSTWHDEALTKTKTDTWLQEGVNVSTYIDSVNDINNLVVRYESYANQGSKEAYIDYVVVDVG